MPDVNGFFFSVYSMSLQMSLHLVYSQWFPVMLAVHCVFGNYSFEGRICCLRNSVCTFTMAHELLKPLIFLCFINTDSCLKFGSIMSF